MHNLRFEQELGCVFFQGQHPFFHSDGIFSGTIEVLVKVYIFPLGFHLFKEIWKTDLFMLPFKILFLPMILPDGI
jgi:hypothetical protein